MFFAKRYSEVPRFGSGADKGVVRAGGDVKWHWQDFQPFKAAGLAFGLAASPCTTPVLAVLLAWIASTGNPLLGLLFLLSFGIGQVLPLLLAGSVAASIPKLMALRSVSRWIPSLSGVILLTVGTLTLLARVV